MYSNIKMPICIFYTSVIVVKFDDQVYILTILSAMQRSIGIFELCLIYYES